MSLKVLSSFLMMKETNSDLSEKCYTSVIRLKALGLLNC